MGRWGYNETSELGLYLAGAGAATGRYYDPETGQFISADSVEDDLNTYRYVRNNPVNLSDPSGSFPWLAILGLVALGALEGAIIGGLSALINCTNFWEEVLWGGLIGGILGPIGGAIGWAIGRAGGFIGSRIGGFIGRWGKNLLGGLTRGGRRGASWRVCFPAGTPISTPSGSQMIECLEVGDKIFSWDFKQNQRIESVVSTIFVSSTQNVVNLTTDDNETLTTTVGHPFWVPDSGWIPADKLQLGMSLMNDTGGQRLIEKISESEKSVLVYNLEVKGSHNYFAGHSRVLVHNIEALPNEFTDFNNATRDALEWLKSQGADISGEAKPLKAKFGPHRGKPIGVEFADGSYFRIEFDARSRAHINAQARGKGPKVHLLFEGSQKTVDKLISRLFRC